MFKSTSNNSRGSKTYEPTSPIKSFVKMIDFRQDDIRNIKNFLANTKIEN